MDYMNMRRCTGMVHKVRTGETMYHLSRMYNVSIDDLIAANPGVNVYNMQNGDEICIPVSPERTEYENNRYEDNRMMQNISETMESQNVKEDFYELVKRFDK